MIPRLTDGTPSAEEIIQIIPQFQQQLGILKSVQKCFESSLFGIKRETEGKAGKKHGRLNIDFTGLFQFFVVLRGCFLPSYPLHHLIF